MKSRFVGRMDLPRVTRIALWLVVFFALYDGAIRKWLLPESEQIVFIFKDAILTMMVAVAVLSFSRGRALATRVPASVQAFLGLYGVWVALEAFNPHLPNGAVALWGVKSHLLYAAFLLLLPIAFRSPDDVFRALARWYGLCVIPVCLLAFAQVFAPADNILNAQIAGSATALAYFGEAGLVRVSGSFSYISGMASFVQVSCMLGLALYLYGARSRIFLIAMAFALMALPVTGSRSVIAVAVVGALILISAAAAARLTDNRALLRFVIVTVALVALSLYTQDAAWDALAERTMQSREDENRAITAFTNAFEFFEAAGMTGFGAGAANLGSAALSDNVPAFSWLPADLGFDEESGRLVLELGIVGWGISLAMRVLLMGWCLQLLSAGRLRSSRCVAALALPLMALGIHQGNGVFATPLLAMYYWFCVALMGMARFAEREARRSRDAHWRAEPVRNR